MAVLRAAFMVGRTDAACFLPCLDPSGVDGSSPTAQRIQPPGSSLAEVAKAMTPAVVHMTASASEHVAESPDLPWLFGPAAIVDLSLRSAHASAAAAAWGPA